MNEDLEKIKRLQKEQRLEMETLIKSLDKIQEGITPDKIDKLIKALALDVSYSVFLEVKDNIFPTLRKLDLLDQDISELITDISYKKLTAKEKEVIK